jgi:asparagine synthase (glutamine-hydrolysing)
LSFDERITNPAKFPDKRNFGDLLPGCDQSEIEESISKISAAADSAVDTLPRTPVVLGYSGGIDSGILASLLAAKKYRVRLLGLGRKGSSDLKAISLIKESSQSELDPDMISIERSDIERAAQAVSRLVQVSNLSHFEDCTAFWLLAENVASFPEFSSILSANGPDELFCGYDRFRRILDSDGYPAVESEIMSALNKASDLSRQVSRVLSEFGFGISEPFLSENFRRASLEIPFQFKILVGNDLLRKRIWRCFGRSLGLPEEIVTRPKKAMQYGMGIHAIVSSMLKRRILKLDFLENNNR